MKLHNLKIRAEYAKAKLDGKKPFEICFNDRDYQVGDYVQYTVIDDQGLNEIFKNKMYEITYITEYEQKSGYVVFSEKELQFTARDAIILIVKYAIGAHGSLDEEADEMTLNGNDIDHIAEYVAKIICGKLGV